MRIGVISDTHTPSTSREPPIEVARAFEGVDLILHAGDILISSCLDWLEQIAPVKAVELGADLRFANDPRVEEKRIVQADGYSIGMVHDLILRGLGGEVLAGTIPRVFQSDGSLSEAVERVFGSPVDIVVFGHTHHAVVEKHQGILVVNPGSPTLPKQIRKLGQVAIMELTPEGADARIVDLSEFS